MTKKAKPILIFDWDGVIVDSHSFKWGLAWEKTFKRNEEQKKMAQDLLSTKEGRGFSRYEFAKNVLISLGREDLSRLSAKEVQDDPEILQILETFSKILRQEYTSYVKLFPEVEKTLKDLYKKGYTKRYVISGTEEKDLNYVAKELKIDDHFTALFGAPRTKPENFKRIVEHEKNSGYRSFIVVGDGEEDVKLAQYIGCQFVGITNEWNEWSSKDKNFSLIDSISDIKEILTT